MKKKSNNYKNYWKDADPGELAIMDEIATKNGFWSISADGNIVVKKLTFGQRRFLDKCVQGTWKLQPDGTVYVKGDIFVAQLPTIQKMPVQFGVVHGSFNCNGSKLTTLVGSPLSVTNDYNCGMCEGVTSLEGITPRISRLLDLSAQFTSLRNSHKYLRSVNKIHTSAKSNLLGLLYIKDIKVLKIWGDNKLDDLMKALYVDDTLDIHEKQERLIEAGFPDAAKL